MARSGIQALRGKRKRREVNIEDGAPEPSPAVTRNHADAHYIDNTYFNPTIPPEYCLISEAVYELEKSMFGNLSRPDEVAKIKKFGRDLSVGLASRMQDAKANILNATLKGKLRVYRLKPHAIAIQPMERNALSRLIPVRGGLPDYVGHLVRANNKTAREEDAAEDLRDSILLLHRREFEDWREAERSKKKWPSQNASTPKPGRPKISRELWTRLITGLVDQKKWRRSLGVPALRRKLHNVSDARPVPSEDTLTRIISDMYVLTQNPKIRLSDKRLHLKKRRKSPQN